MILADSSAWIEFLRATGSPIHRRMRKLLDARAGLATTGPVVLELLAGARDERHLVELKRLLAQAQMLSLRQPEDFESAAAIYRSARAAGFTVRRTVDCLIASVAIREGVPVLHRDADFDAIAAVTPLGIAG